MPTGSEVAEPASSVSGCSLCEMNRFRVPVGFVYDDHLRDLRKSVVEASIAQVKNLAADDGQRGVQRSNNAGRYVVDVNERAPLFAIEDGDDAFVVGFGHQKIHYQ